MGPLQAPGDGAFLLILATPKPLRDVNPFISISLVKIWTSFILPIICFLSNSTKRIQ